MNVLSLFDGISVGQLALKRAGISYQNYYASEIDSYCIKVTQHNFPKTIQLGNIENIDETILSQLPQIDLLLGAPPCQGFSSSGKGLNFSDPRSKLFFDFVRILNIIQPKYFLMENVNMKTEWSDIISSYLNTKPIFINSRLVSAQDRKRLYWTNILGIVQPKDKNISFADICEDNGFCAAMRGRRINSLSNARDDHNKTIPIKQYLECRKDNKSNCLTTVAKDNVVVYKKISRTVNNYYDFY